MLFTASLLDAQYKKDSVENKPDSLLVVPLGKALNGMPLHVADRWWGQAVHPSWWPSREEVHIEQELTRKKKIKAITPRDQDFEKMVLRPTSLLSTDRLITYHKYNFSVTISNNHTPQQ